VVGIIIVLDLFLVGIVCLPPVQTAIVTKITAAMSRKLQSEFSIKHVYITPMFSFIGTDVVFKDHKNNNMIYVPYVKSHFTALGFSPFKISFGATTVRRAEVTVRKYADEDRVNIAIWADHFKKKDKTTRTPFLIRFDYIDMENSRFLYQNDDVKSADNQGVIDYGYFELKDINLKTADFNLENLPETFEIRAFITQISLKQYTGFQIDKMSGAFCLNQYGLSLAGMHLATPNSNAYMDFALQYNDWSDYGQFVDSVRFNATIYPSMVNIKDVAYFAPKLKGMDNRIVLTGKTNGNVNELKMKDVFARFGHHTYLKGNFEIDDIVSNNAPAYHFVLQESNLNIADLSFFKLPQNKSLSQLNQLNGVINAKATGCFHGTARDFDSNIDLVSDIGNVSVSLGSKTEGYQVHYNGKASSDGFNIGKLLDNQKLFNYALFDAKLQATIPNTSALNIKLAKAYIDADISSLDFAGYHYQNIRLKSNVRHKNVEVKMISDDAHCNFSLDGLVDLTAKEPFLNASLNLKNVDVTQLFAKYDLPNNPKNGLDKTVAFLLQRPNITVAANDLTIRLSGHQIDDANGYVAIDGLTITQQQSSQSPLNIYGERLRLTLINTETGLHKYNFASTFLNASLSTNYELEEMLDSLIAMGYKYLPNLLPQRQKKSQGIQSVAIQSIGNDKYMDLEIETYRTRALLDMFMPGLQIAPRSSLYCHIPNDGKKQLLSVDVPQLVLKDRFKLYGLKIIGQDTAANKLLIDVSLDTGIVKMGGGQFAFKNINLDAQASHNLVNYKLSWIMPESISSHLSLLLGNVKILDNQNIVSHIAQSSIFIKDKEWKTIGRNSIVVGKDDFIFDDVKLVSDESSLTLDGTISQNMNDNLNIIVQHVDMSLLNQFTYNMKMQFAGDVSAEFIFTMLPNQQRALTGRACVSNFVFNETPFGNLFAVAAVNAKGIMGFSGGIFLRDEPINSTMIESYSVQDFRSEQHRMADLRGYYLPDKKTFTVNGDIDTLNIGFLSPYFEAFSQHVSGIASGDLTFIAKPDSTYFDGTVIVQNARMGIKALNTIYTIQNQIIEFDQRGIKLNNVVVKDRDNNEAYLTGTILHHNFKDFKLNLNVNTARIMALNAPRSSDVYFYGDGFVAGHVSIIGDATQLSFKGSNLRTLSGTMFYLPLTFADKVSETPGIRFKIKQDAIGQTQQKPSSMVLDMDFIFNITKDAVINLILDPSIGGSVRATALGTCRVQYNTNSELLLNGDVTLVSGEFALSLKDILNRRLELMPGGTISFNGSIDDARISLQALHTANNVSLTDILPDMSTSGLARGNRVNAYINLSGNLFDPNIGFSFKLPNSSNEINSMLMSAIDTTNAQNNATQFFALLLTDNFLPQNRVNDPSNMFNVNTLGNAGIAMVSGVIGNMLSKNIKFAKIGVNYKAENKTTDNYSAAEYGGNVTIPLFNNRVIFQTNVNYIDDKNASSTADNIKVEASAEIPFNDNWRMKLFNFNDQYSWDHITAQTMQGVGVSIIFQQEFNNKVDFLANYRRKKAVKK